MNCRHKRNIFQGGSKSLFPIFPGMKCFFLLEIAILVDPKQLSVVSKSDKPKKKKRVLCSFPYLVPFHLTFLLLPFYNFPSFLLHFPFFFLCLFFPDKSTKISREKCLWGTVPPYPLPACYTTKAQNTFLVTGGQGLFWTNSTKSSPLVYILPLTNIFQKGYFVKFGGKSPLAPLYFEPCTPLRACRPTLKNNSL